MKVISQHDIDLEMIAAFRMFDDTFMSAVFDKQISETQYLINTILERNDIIVTSSKAQYTIHNIYGRETRLDILAHDSKGHAYHFEVQRNLSGANAKRARFTGALVDVGLLKKGQLYQEIPDRYTIFITEKDMFKIGLPIYHAEYRIKELNNKILGDGSHIIYVNGEFTDLDTPIGQLMHDFSCVKSQDILIPILRDRVKYLKETEGGQEEMCEIMDKLMENRVNLEKTELAKDAISQGDLSIEQIAKVLKLPVDYVRELANEQVAFA